MEWTKGQIPRFHPVAGFFGGIEGWYVADSLMTLRNNRVPVQPYIDAPCESKEEAEEVATLLNETEPDPRKKDEDDVHSEEK